MAIKTGSLQPGSGGYSNHHGGAGSNGYGFAAHREHQHTLTDEEAARQKLLRDNGIEDRGQSLTDLMQHVARSNATPVNPAFDKAFTNGGRSHSWEKAFNSHPADLVAQPPVPAAPAPSPAAMLGNPAGMAGMAMNQAASTVAANPAAAKAAPSAPGSMISRTFPGWDGMSPEQRTAALQAKAGQGAPPAVGKVIPEAPFNFAGDQKSVNPVTGAAVTTYDPTQDTRLRGRNPDGSLPIDPKYGGGVGTVSYHPSAVPPMPSPQGAAGPAGAAPKSASTNPLDKLPDLSSDPLSMSSGVPKTASFAGVSTPLSADWSTIKDPTAAEQAGATAGRAVRDTAGGLMAGARGALDAGKAMIGSAVSKVTDPVSGFVSGATSSTPTQAPKPAALPKPDEDPNKRFALQNSAPDFSF